MNTTSSKARSTTPISRSNDLESKLDAAGVDQAKYKAAVEEAKAQFPDFPSRVAAIDDFASTYQDYVAVKGTLDDAGDLKRLLKGSGVLEFHILADDPSSPEVQALRERLPKSGPRPQAGDTLQMGAARSARKNLKATARDAGHVQQQVVRAGFDADRQQLVNGPGIAHWGLERPIRADRPVWRSRRRL